MTADELVAHLECDGIPPEDTAILAIRMCMARWDLAHHYIIYGRPSRNEIWHYAFRRKRHAITFIPLEAPPEDLIQVGWGKRPKVSDNLPLTRASVETWQ